MSRTAGLLDKIASETSDEDLLDAILGEDPNLALIARQLWDRKHRDDPQPAEPPHCDECFEGCPKCRR